MLIEPGTPPEAARCSDDPPRGMCWNVACDSPVQAAGGFHALSVPPEPPDLFGVSGDVSVDDPVASVILDPPIAMYSRAFFAPSGQMSVDAPSS
jgi:hypothetical protein